VTVMGEWMPLILFAAVFVVFRLLAGPGGG
jgi:hypothetical protein